MVAAQANDHHGGKPLMGRDLEKHPELGRRIADAKHEIGNHTYNHQRMIGVLPSTVAREVEDTAQEVAQQMSAQTKPGSIILLPPMYAAREQTRQALRPIFTGLKERGHRFLTVSALLGSR